MIVPHAKYALSRGISWSEVVERDAHQTVAPLTSVFVGASVVLLTFYGCNVKGKSDTRN